MRCGFGRKVALAVSAGIASLFLMAADGPTKLVIDRQGNQLVLSFTNVVPGSVLEVARDLGSTTGWQATLTLSNNQSPLLLDATAPTEFYRVREPSGFVLEHVAPPLSQTAFADLHSATEFLYTGSNAVQTGIEPNAIQAQRAAVVRGRVLYPDGGGMEGVGVTVVGRPEYGQTFTRADGGYDLAVNGGFDLRLSFDKSGYCSAQRTVPVRILDYHRIPDVILLRRDAVVTLVELGPASPGAIARGSTQADEDGSRRATVVLPPGTSATLVMPNGASNSVSSLSLRATEFTVGTNGPASMPAALPPSSGYTYAVELNADEAVAAGASTIQFDRDVPFYLENFLEFPVGIPVPSAFYDRARGAWVPTRDGRVLRIVQVVNGAAELDTDGDGTVDNGASLGITQHERERLAGMYVPNQTLWRMPLRHFTEYDFNYGTSPAPGAVPPQQPQPETGADGSLPGSGGGGGPKVDDPTPVEGNGVVEFENQVLRERVPLVGTPFSLQYRSDEAEQDPTASQLYVRLSGQTVPSVLKGIRLTIDIAGRTFVQNYPPGTNLSHLFTWDGFDAYGRKLLGQQSAHIAIHYLYDGYYNMPANADASFGLSSGQPVPGNVRTRSYVTLSQTFTKTVGGFSRKNQGLGGWAWNVQHAYDPLGKVLYMGSGERRSVEGLTGKPTIKRFAGRGSGGQPIGDGGPALAASLNNPRDAAFGPDGSLYIAEFRGNRVRKVTPEGLIYTVAGTGVAGFSGDGGPAVSAQLNRPQGVAVGVDGSIYIADSNNLRVRRVAPDGTITTVAGSGSFSYEGPLGDNGPATEANMRAWRVAIAPDNTLYIVDDGHERVRRVGPDGMITTFAGNGISGLNGDGGPATEAELSFVYDVAVGPDGSVYIGEFVGNRVRRVSPDGIITTFAGGGTLPDGTDQVPATSLEMDSIFGVDVAPDGVVYISESDFIYEVTTDGIAHLYAGGGDDSFTDGLPARQAQLAAQSVTVGPDGSIYTCESSVRRIARSLPGFGGSDILLPSADGAEIYVFSRNGRHRRTVLALTGATLLEFDYDPAGRLTGVTDSGGLRTFLERDANGNPSAVVAPFGQRTTLTLSPNGWLASVVNPAGEAIQFEYPKPGLLGKLTTPSGDFFHFQYNDEGRLVQFVDPGGGLNVLTRTNTPFGHEVKVTSSLGRVTRFIVERQGGNRVRRTIFPDGRKREDWNYADGSRDFIEPDGTIFHTVLGPDPRFGMQAAFIKAQTITTPAGLISESVRERTVILNDADNPFSLAAFSENTIVNGRSYSSSFDPATRTFTQVSPEGRQSVITMDEFGRTVFEQRGGLAPYFYGFDQWGRITNMVVGTGPVARANSITYDSAGYVGSIINPIGQGYTYTYTPSGYQTSLAMPGERTIYFTNNDAGFITETLPPDRPAHRFAFSPLNQLTSYTAPVVNGETNRTLFAYNADRQPTNIVRPDGHMVTFSYDDRGRLGTTSVPEGQALSFQYDSITGQLTNVATAGGETLELKYDGRLLTHETWRGIVRGTLQRTFDADGRIISRQVNDLPAVPYSYDHDSYIITAGEITITRDPAHGYVTATSLGNISETRGYDQFGYANSNNATVLGTSVYSYLLGFDRLGRITNKVETIQGITTTNHYGYDVANRLSEVWRDGVLLATYTYDPNGNRLAWTNGVNFSQASYDAQDRLVSYSSLAGQTVYTHNRQGQLSARSVNGQTTTYSYDARGNLRAVTLPNGTVIQYIIDGSDRRIGRKVNGVLTAGFLYESQLRPIAQLDGSNGVVSLFVYGSRPNVPDYLIQGSNTYRLLSDHLGSVRFVVNTVTGFVIQQLEYDEYGRVLADTNPGFQPFGFAGGLYDPETGLVRFGSRDYDAATGRWTARDPLGFYGGDANLYAYTGNNPLNAIDPQGTDYINLNDSGAVGGNGHAAALVGNEQDGWDYYCKEGLSNGPLGDSLATMRHYKTLEDFKQSPESQRYDRGAWVNTTADEDAKMRDYGRRNFDTPYGLCSNNCADLAGGIYKASGREAPNVVAGAQDLITVPNDQYDGFIQYGIGEGFQVH